MKGILRGCPRGDLMQFIRGHCDTDLDSSASKLQDEVSRQKAGIPSPSLTWNLISKSFPTDPWSIPQPPNPPTKSLCRNSFLLAVWGCLGYAPGVCWGSLR